MTGVIIMMKRNILTMLIPALLAVGASHGAEIYNADGNKLDLYGKLDAEHYISSSSDGGFGGNGDQTYIRTGFVGQTQINDQLTGYGQWIYQFSGNDTESGPDSVDGDHTRLGFAGLKYAHYGSFDYGRNWGIIYDSIGWVDMLPEFGGYTKYTDDFMAGRASGLATYRNNNFFGLVNGLNLALQYQGKNDRPTDPRRANGDGYGGSVTYVSPIGLGIVGAYASSDRTDAQNATYYGRGDRAEQWTTTVKYDANNIYVAANYGETHNTTWLTNKLQTNPSLSGFANTTHDTMIVAQYQFDFGLRPSVAYSESKAKDIEGIGDVDLYKYYEIGATYFFNKNMFTYVDYIINVLDKNNKLGYSTGDTVAVALVYQF